MSEKEIIELVASIEAVKDFTKDFDVIFNFINEDDSKDKKIDALENVINSATNYVKQFVSLDENEIVEYTPIYDVLQNCWILPINKLNGEFYAYIFRSDNGATYVDRVPFEDGRFYSKELSQVGSLLKRAYIITFLNKDNRVVFLLIKIINLIQLWLMPNI